MRINQTEKIGKVDTITNGKKSKTFDCLLSDVVKGQQVQLSDRGKVFMSEGTVVSWIRRLTTNEMYIRTTKAVYHSTNCVSNAAAVQTA